MGFVMFYLVKYHVIFHSAGVCDHKNKLSVEVGKGFFQRFFLNLNAYKCRNTSLGDVGAGGLCELSPFVTRLLWMYTGS